MAPTADPTAGAATDAARDEAADPARVGTSGQARITISGVQQAAAMSRFELRWWDVDGAAPAVTSEARLYLAIEELHDHGGGEGRSERKED